MSRELELKKLPRESLEAALERAKHYRLLNDPGPADSICEDVLAIDPGNQEALRIRVLALCDRLIDSGSVGVRNALDYASQLADEYQREYYSGLVHERSARAQLRKRAPEYKHRCFECLERAMAHYARAEPIAPEANDDALLRWNHCLRLLRANRELEAAPPQRFEVSLLE